MKILITAGPTREPIDAVRYISNRSSGKMGIALAHAAAAAGHEVGLLLGRGAADRWVAEPTAPGARVRVYGFDSSSELKQLIEAHWRDHDVLLMAAAVADYRPTCVEEGKIHRETDTGPLRIELQPTPDLVALAAATKRPDQRVVAFALEEPHDLEQRAVKKMRVKGVDAIVANPLGTMDAESITGILFTSDGRREDPGRMRKDEFAAWLIAALDRL